MSAFDEVLRELAGELDLPEPIRSRTLLELRSDLEGMAAALESRGLAREEARSRALESLRPSPAAVRDLGRVHRPLYQRVVDRFSVRGRHRIERGLLVVLALLYLALGLSGLARFDLLASPSPFLWPVLGIAVLIGLVGASKLFRLYVVGAYGPGLRRGLDFLLGLAASALMAGFAGAVLDFYRVAGRISGSADRQLPELLGWLRQDMALLTAALLAASAAGMIWLVAAVRIARIEQTEAAALGVIEPRRQQ